MKDKALYSLAGFLVFLSIIVDFTSKVLSIGSDFILLGLAGYFGYLAFKNNK